MAKYSFFLGQGGTGGSSIGDLNIHYGSSAPTDTTKLWVTCNTPEKVLMDNNANIGYDQLIIDNTGLDTASSSITNFIKKGDYIYYCRESTSSGVIHYTLHKYNMTTKEDTELYDIAAGTTSSYTWFAWLVDDIKNSNIYLGYGFYVASDRGGLIVYRINTDNDSRTKIYDKSGIYDIAVNSSDYTLAINGVFYKINGSRTTDFENIISSGTGNSKGIIANDDGSMLYVISRIGSTNNYTYNLYSIDTSTMVSTNLGQITGLPTTTLFSNQAFKRFAYYNNNLIFVASSTATGLSEGSIYSVNLNTRVATRTAVSGNALNGSYGNQLGQVIDNKYYISGNQMTYLFYIDLESKTLMINFNTNSSRWKAINTDGLVLELNPISVYLGDSNNQGIKQTAKLYNGSGWVDI